MKVMIKIIMTIMVIATMTVQAAPKPDDSDALKGVVKGKVIFDINMVSAKKMTLYLMVIDETVDDLVRQGVEPDVVLAFRGKSVNMITKNRDNVELTDFEYLDKISAQINVLQKKAYVFKPVP